MSDKAGRIQNKNNFANTAPKGINYLLAIGIDAYQYCARLYNCVKDAEDFMHALLSKYRFEPQHIDILFNEQATRRNILNHLRDLRTKITNQDSLIIYFSGHGEYDAKSQMGFWIPVEAHPLEDAEYISNTDITARLDAIDSFHTFLIVDACFAGSLFVNYKNVQPGAESKRSRWGLAASHSREVALDGTRGDNSPFARCLIRTINQNTLALGVQELAAEVIDQVQQETNGKQTPVGQPLNVRGHDLGQFFFHLKKNELQDWAAAQKENTLAAYERFLILYPTGTHTEEAKNMVAFLQEEAAWKEACTTNTIAAYDHYLQQYRQGRYRRLAIDAQKTIEEADAWTRATQRNTISGYRDFQYNYSESKYYNEAEARIQRLQTPVQQPIAPPVQLEPKKRLESKYYIGGTTVHNELEVKKEPTKPVENKDDITPNNVIPNYKKSRIPYIAGGVGLLLIITLLIWQPWQQNKSKEPVMDSTQTEVQSNLEEQKAFTDARDEATKIALTLFLQKYPNGTYASEAKEEMRKMEEVRSAFKNAQAYLKGGLIEDTTIELEKAAKLNSNNKFIQYALDALKEQDYKKALKMIEDGIQLQNQKLLPPAPVLGSG